MSSMLSIWKGVSEQLTPRASPHSGTAQECNPFDAGLGAANGVAAATGSSASAAAATAKGGKGKGGGANGVNGVGGEDDGSSSRPAQSGVGGSAGPDGASHAHHPPHHPHPHPHPQLATAANPEGHQHQKGANRQSLAASLGFHLAHLGSTKRSLQNLEAPNGSRAASFDDSGTRTPLARTPMGGTPGSASPTTTLDPSTPGLGGSFFGDQSTAPPQNHHPTSHPMQTSISLDGGARHHQRQASGGMSPRTTGGLALKAPQTTSVSKATPDFTFKANPITRAKNVLRDSVGAATGASTSGAAAAAAAATARETPAGPAKAKDATATVAATAKSPTSLSFAAHRAGGETSTSSHPPASLSTSASSPARPPTASTTPRSAAIDLAPAASTSRHKPTRSEPGSGSLPPPRGLLSVKLVSGKNLAATHAARPYIVASYDNSEFVSREPIAEDESEARGVAGSRRSNGGAGNAGPPGSNQSNASGSTAVGGGEGKKKVAESNGNGVLCLSGQNPIWKHEVDFDVVGPSRPEPSPRQHAGPSNGAPPVMMSGSRTVLVVSVYDRSIGDDETGGGVEGLETFLGEAEIRLDFEKLKAQEGWFDEWYSLHSRGGHEQLSGEVRVQLKYKEFATRKGLSVNDFDFLKMIGRGTFGRVFQVRKKDTKRIYAMKVLSKKEVIAKKEVAHTLGERNILQRSSECAFLLGLKFSFQSPGELFLVMDYKSGGELFHHLQKEGRFTEERARFYTAEIVLAFEHLHKYDIVYRDLKPENILLDATGHIVLCDFGLSKPDLPSDALTTTFCGTTEYLAPEVLLDDHGYSKLVDFWSLGVLLFEMCCGWSPFYAEDTQQMYKNICFGKIKFPRGVIGDDGKQFVKGLLNRNPRHRLGAQRDAQELKEHAFFRTIDWVALEARQVSPPFKPFVDSDESVANFDAEFTEADILQEMPMPAIDENDRSADWIQHVSGSVPSPRELPANRRRSQDSMSEQFRGFSYAGEAEHFPSSRFAMTSIE